MSEAVFFGELNVGGLQVEGSLYMHNTNFGPILALPGANVKGDAKYGGGRPPGQVDLTGFHYERILSEQLQRRAVDGPPVDWPSLNRQLMNLQVPHSSEPYEHLASVLRRMGDTETAISVLHDSAACDLAVRLGWSHMGRCREMPVRSGSALAVLILLSLAGSGLTWRHGSNLPALPAWFNKLLRMQQVSTPAPPVPPTVPATPFATSFRRWPLFLALLTTTLIAIFMLFNTEATAYWIGTIVKLLYGLVVGFGYYPQLAIYWVLEFTILGVFVLSFSQTARSKGLLWCFGASLDHLLPIVELNKEFADFFDGAPGKLKAWQLHYFAFHALVGFVLASFVVAGLSGLTAKG